jgi:hypothetical protein
VGVWFVTCRRCSISQKPCNAEKIKAIERRGERLEPVSRQSSVGGFSWETTLEPFPRRAEIGSFSSSSFFPILCSISLQAKVVMGHYLAAAKRRSTGGLEQ